MVKLNGTNKFYGRNSTGKYPMDVMEIKNAFLESNKFSQKIETFRLDRLNAVKSGKSFFPNVEFNPAIVLHIFPTSTQTAIDIEKSQNELQSFIPIASKGWGPIINFEGFCVYDHDRSYTQIYRDGTIESVCCWYIVKDRRSGSTVFDINRCEKELISHIMGYIRGLMSLGFSGFFLDKHFLF